MVAAEAAAHDARAQLIRIARVTNLGELTASIAHEVNQPLAGIVSSSNACLRWLGQDSPNLEKACASAERILSDANRAAAVIQRVRSLVRHEAPKRERVDLNDIVDEAIALAQGELDRHGIGFAAGDQEHLFEAFWTTREGGTGIGLTISRAIVEAHGGRIWAAANVPSGAVFRVSLPVSGARQ